MNDNDDMANNKDFQNRKPKHSSPTRNPSEEKGAEALDESRGNDMEEALKTGQDPGQSGATNSGADGTETS